MTEIITSLQNERVKLAHGLQTRARTRRKERKIVLEGAKLIQEALDRRHKPFFAFYQPDTADYEMVAALQDRKVELFQVNGEVMRHASDMETPSGLLAVFPLPVPPLPKSPRHVLIFDNLRDPGNMGTMLRTAAAAGVDVALLSPGCADPYNPKTLRSGMGAHFRLPVVEAEWYEIRDYCDGLTVYLAAGDGTLRYDRADWKKPWALIIGSEGEGAGRQAEEIATTRIHIPMAAQTESLNAAVAAGVVLFEAARQNFPDE
ncbi:MAG: RNA methyltransferase [bacterium]|nr:RNA methyltransferase [bacterium]